MAFGFKSEEEVQEYLEKLGIEYKFSCFSEKNPEGCHLLGDYLEAVKKEFASAAKVYKSNCDERNYGKSCFKFGNYSYLGKGCDSNSLLAFSYYKKACDLNHADACLHFGVMLTSKEDIPGKNNSEITLDFPNGVKALEKACTGGNITGCFLTSSLYMRGVEGVPADKKKASEFAQKACNGGNIYACINLSKMYKNGDGVEKDEVKANIFKEKARELRDDMKRKPSIGFQQHT